MFDIGEIVKMRLNGDWVMILSKGREQYNVRTKDMREIYVYNFEIEKC